MPGVFIMLDFVLKYWVLILFAVTVYGWILKLSWRVSAIGKSRSLCETRCENRVDILKAEYNDDLKTIREDLKETVKLSQSMNLSLVSLTAYLQGKGVTPP
jgi:hypothetical protein